MGVHWPDRKRKEAKFVVPSTILISGDVARIFPVYSGDVVRICTTSSLCILVTWPVSAASVDNITVQAGHPFSLGMERVEEGLGWTVWGGTTVGQGSHDDLLGMVLARIDSPLSPVPGPRHARWGVGDGARVSPWRRLEPPARRRGGQEVLRRLSP